MTYDPAYRRAYYERHREEAAAQSRERYLAKSQDPEWYARMLASNRRYHAEHGDAVKARQRANRADPAVSAARAAYQRDLRRKAARRRWEIRPEYDAVAAARNANRRAARLGIVGRISAADVRAVIGAGPCVRCGSTERPSLDHVIPLSRGGVNFPVNLQRLCFDCNSTKRDKTPSEVAA